MTKVLFVRSAFVLFFSLSACLLTESCGLTAEAAKRRYLDRGIKAADAGNLEDAAINFRKAIQKDPQYAEAYYRLAELELRRKNAAEAYRLLSQTVEMKPDYQEAAVLFGDLCLSAYAQSEKRPRLFYDQTNKMIDRLLARDPNSFDGIRMKGQLAVVDRKPQEAIETLTRADRIKPDQPSVILALFQAHLLNDDPKTAENLMRGFLAKNKKDSKVYDALYGFYVVNNRMADAEALLKDRVANNPEDSANIIQLANHYAATNRMADATALLERMLQNRKQFPDAQMLAGDFYLNRHMLDEALRQFEAGRTDNPKLSLLYSKRIAKVLAEQGKREEAQNVLREVLREKPDDEEAARQKAALDLSTGKYPDVETAITSYRSLVNRNPNDADLRLALGKSYLAKGDLGSARPELVEALKRRPDDNTIRMLVVETCLRQQDFNEALRLSSEALQLDGNNLQARIGRSLALSGLRDYVGARNELTNVLKVNPQQPDALMHLALLDVVERKYQEADDIFRRLYQPGQTDPRVLQGMVDSRLAQRQFDQALQLLNAELERSPNSRVARVALGSTLLRAQKYDQAIQQFQTILQQEPNSIDMLVRIGEAYQLKGDLKSAAATFERARAANPKDVRAHAYYAYVMELSGKKQEAVESYRRALELEPENPLLLNNIAFLMADIGQNYDEAMNFATRAQRRVPNNPAIDDTIGWIYLKRGMSDSAIQVFTNLVRRYPEIPSVRYHYAMALLQKGENAKAQSELSKALANKPSSKEEAEIRSLIAKIS